MRYLKKPFYLGIIVGLFFTFIHLVFSYAVKDLRIIRLLRPIRDILFFPFLLISENIWEIYCGIAKFISIGEQRCILHPGQIIPDGPPQWFEISMSLLALFLLLIAYGIVFMFVSKIWKRFQS